MTYFVFSTEDTVFVKSLLEAAKLIYADQPPLLASPH